MELKITKGKFTVSDQGDNGLFILPVPNIGAIARVYTENYAIDNIDQAKANASLITEAFNVANETGLTPRELLNGILLLREAINVAQSLIVGGNTEDWTIINSAISKTTITKS